jgi:hypothetical protein
MDQGWRKYAIVAASVLALLAVVITLLWPRQVSKLFRLRTDSVTSDRLRVPVDPSIPASAGAVVPPAASAGALP